MGSGIIRGADTVFGVAFLFGTIGAEGGAGDTLTDDVPFAQLQEVTIKDSFGMRKLMGNTQLTAVSIGATERNLTGDAKFGTLRLRMLQMLRGGEDPTYDSGDDLTTWDSLIDEEPTPFNLHLMSPDDGSDIEVIIYNCLSPELTHAFKLRDYYIPEFTFEASGDPVTKRLMRFIRPGDHSSN